MTRVLVAVGLAVVLSLGALALWPVVGDAPWEPEPVVIERRAPRREPRVDPCERLIQAMNSAPTAGTWIRLRQQARVQGCF